MSPVFLVLVSISALFPVFLIFKRLTKLEICAICASVSITWIILLMLYWLGKFEYPIIIAALMGQSVVGLYYLLEKKVKKDFLIFRLPFLLTATFLVFVVLGHTENIGKSIALLLALWTLFGFAYFYRSNSRLSGIVKRIIECCKNW